MNVDNEPKHRMDRAGCSALHYAALEDDPGAIARLLAAGGLPDVVDRQGFTPLHLAAQEFGLRAAASLIDAGARADAENVFGNTPLWVAVFNSKGRGGLY